MKKLLLVLVLIVAVGSFLAIALGFTATCAWAGNRIKGSGNVITRTMDAPSFHKIDASRGIKVILSETQSGKITIAADDNIIDYVIVRTDEGELDITIDKSVNRISNYDITVTVPDNGRIRSLEASSAAKIIAEPLLSANEFEIDVSSAAKITASVNATHCSVEASSASEVDLTLTATSCEAEASSAASISIKGSADRFEAEASSAAGISANEFAVATCSADASSGASIKVNCSDALRAKASSGSSVRYPATCKSVNISTSSGGSVKKM